MKSIRSSRPIRRTALALAAASALGPVLTSPAQATDYPWNGGVTYTSAVGPSSLVSGDTLEINAGGYFSGWGLQTPAGSTVNWLGGNLGFQSGTVVVNAGLWNVDSPAPIQFYDAGYGGRFVNNAGGVLSNTGRGALTVLASGSFAFASNGGTVSSTAAAIDFTSGGYGSVVFNDGSSFGGTSAIVIGGNGASFAGQQNFNAGSNVQFAAGYFYNNGSGAAATLNGTASWTGGTFTGGSWNVAQGSVLNVTTPGYAKDLSAVSFTNNGSINWTTTDTLGFQSGSVLTNNGSFVASAATTLADASYGGTFVNNGLLQDAGGGTVTVAASGSFSFQNNGSGMVSALTAGDALLFSSGGYGAVNFAGGSQFSGAGTINIGGNGATFSGAQTIAAGTNLLFDGSYFSGAGTGGAQINGSANWTNGSFIGTWTLAAGSALNVATGGAKNFDGVNFVNNGSINWATTDSVGFQSSGLLTNNGSFVASAATTLYDAGFGGTFANNGLFEDAGGGTVTVAAAGSFNFQNNGGTIEALNAGDTIQFSSGGNSQVAFGTGTQFSGGGTISVGGAGAVFTGTQNVAKSTSLVLAAGNLSGTAAQLNGIASWSGGALTGAWTVAADSSLDAATGLGKSVSGGSTAVVNNGTINWATTDSLGFAGGGVLTNNGSFVASAATSLYDAGFGGVFVNNGLFQDAGGGTVTIAAAGSFSFQNSSGGVLQAQGAGDTLLLSTDNYGKASFANGSQFSGAGTIEIGGNGATFSGAQTIAAGTQLLLDGAYFSGAGNSGAQINGNASWTNGSFIGNWTVAAGSVLNAATGGAKNINGAGFVNNGSIAWATTDSLGFQNGAVLTNNGNFIASAATTLYDAGWGGTFVNNGLFQDAGGGTVTVAASGSLDFQNSGTVSALGAGDTIQFSSGGNSQVAFGDGSQFSGAGTIVIGGGGANFTGAQNVAPGTSLVLAAGNLNGTAAQLNGGATWTGGNLTGTWTVASNSVLTAGGSGSAKTLAGGSLVNNGSINWSSTDNLGFQSGATLTNNGSFNVSTDASMVDAGYGGSFVNNGLFQKTAGTGTTSIAQNGSFGFQNNGVVQVLSGTIALGNFANPGSLSGTASFSGNVTNSGHVAPGTVGGAPATLALQGNYAQTSTGFLDIGLGNAAQGLLAVSGSASLAGTVNVSCYGACTFASGTQFEILSSSGLSGDFTNIVATGFTGTNDFSLLQQNNDEFLVLNNNVTAAVPEPRSTAMLLAGLFVVGSLTRRRMRQG